MTSSHGGEPGMSTSVSVCVSCKSVLGLSCSVVTSGPQVQYIGLDFQHVGIGQQSEQAGN